MIAILLVSSVDPSLDTLADDARTTDAFRGTVRAGRANLDDN